MDIEKVSIKQYIVEKLKLINEHIAATVPTENVPAILRESIDYSLFNGGKRVRPILTLASYEAFGLDSKPIVSIACSVELLHTYSLIHDDLPIMDNDDLRRNKPTNHRVFGEGIALLAGDALLTHAFGNIAQELRRLRMSGAGKVQDTDQALQIIEEFAIYAGAGGMVGGQVVDFTGQSEFSGLEQVLYIHEHKTADLVTFSIRLGALLAGASEEQLEKLTVFAKKIGIAFQIQDDILDIVGDQEKTGKTIGSDAANQKLTYPFFRGIEESKQDVLALIAEAKREIADIGINTERLEAIADLFIVREK